ncbi:MAG: glycosyltransferase family 4 protein [Bacteroidetes bacterium]|nr:glycosyltransferase family 4 protein [Bacteroidota bacterium]
MCNLLFISNLIKDKGVVDLLDACVVLQSKCISFRCDFVGPNTDISPFWINQYLEHHSLQELVFFHGAKSGDEKNWFLQNADIFVFPTYYKNECFPLVLLEAMQYSLPIVTTNEGGIADIVSDGHTGIIVEKNNPLQLANSLISLIEDTEFRHSLGVAGYHKFISSFTLDHFELRFSNIIRDVIQSI